MSDFNYGQMSNGHICTCGDHHGVGQWTPEKRAEVYARMRDKLPAFFAPHMAQYLGSWGKNHGHVNWESGK